jgi:hypothetical protein
VVLPRVHQQQHRGQPVRRNYLNCHLCFDEQSAEDRLLARRSSPGFSPTATLHAEITPPPRLRPLLL